MIAQQLFFIAVKAFIVKNNAVLMIQRSKEARDGFEEWEFPGGRMEFGEIPENALIREVKEEAGVSIEILQPISTWTIVRNGMEQTVGITYLCKTNCDKIILSNEHIEYKWVQINDLMSFSGLPENIKDNLKNINLFGLYN